MANHSVPKTKIETLMDIIQGYYHAADPGDMVEDQTVADNTEVGTDSIKRQKKFFAEIGILEKDGYDYTLLEKGNSIGRALAYDQEEIAAENLEDLLSDWVVTDQFLNDLGQEQQSEDDIIESLAFLTETDLSSPRKKTGLKAVVHLYEWTGILEEVDESEYRNPVSTVSEKEENKQEGEEVQFKESSSQRTSDRDDEKSTKEVLDQNQSVANRGLVSDSVPGDINTENELLSIQLELSGDEDPENVRNLIIAVREGFEADLGDKDDTTEEVSENTVSSSDFS